MGLDTHFHRSPKLRRRFAHRPNLSLKSFKDPAQNGKRRHRRQRAKRQGADEEHEAGDKEAAAKIEAIIESQALFAGKYPEISGLIHLSGLAWLNVNITRSSPQ